MQKVIIDASTGDETIRDLTPEEEAQRQAESDAATAARQAEQDQQQARATAWAARRQALADAGTLATLKQRLIEYLDALPR